MPSPNTLTAFTVINTTRQWLITLQTQLCQALAAEETRAPFLNDRWTHPMDQGGCIQGISCVMEDGDVIEKAGVNFSHVTGPSLPKAATQRRPDLQHGAFDAVGLSVIVHPRNPFAPTSHANLRLFVTHPPDHSPAVWWFGGGFDLTPYYGFKEDCQLWHQAAKTACDALSPELYARYKKACDAYFFLPHRQEARGIGGIFFDDLNEWGFTACFSFIQSVGEQFKRAYLSILSRRKSLPYTSAQRDFQCYRRGRYVEFNLLYDRGTAFGLRSGGRTESILVSLPPTVRWGYQWKPKNDTIESRLVNDFLTPRSWIDSL